MRIIVCGYGRLIGPALTYLVHRYGKDNVALYTHPDEDVFGEHAVSVASRLDIRRNTNDINGQKLPFDPDIIISLYYRHIIKAPLIEQINGRIFNCHTSLLPRHRGRSPVPWAIIENDQVTGITYHYIDEGIDTGPIILQATTPIDEDETQLSLFNKLNHLAVEYFPAALELVIKGFIGTPQHGESSYHRRGCPYDGIIDPNWTWGKILRFIRAMTYPPLPYARMADGTEIKSEDDYRGWLSDRSKRHHSLTVSR